MDCGGGCAVTGLDLWGDLDGNFDGLAMLPELSYLQLLSANLGGSLQDLQHLNKTRYLTLHGSEITGSLQDLRHLKRIKALNLLSSKITGSLQDLLAGPAVPQDSMADPPRQRDHRQPLDIAGDAEAGAAVAAQSLYQRYPEQLGTDGSPQGAMPLQRGDQRQLG
ncbi:unnamed protein product [Symbiodinium pilosum]|uniref:Uncharacterized protein n=1 Tax=Symbiodinium pilosum TaxID=2952 RepID=A0A812TK42_SYMPI|nr:unnamed protein product [Symbiodinium pilosum]